MTAKGKLNLTLKAGDRNKLITKHIRKQWSCGMRSLDNARRSTQTRTRKNLKRREEVKVVILWKEKKLDVAMKRALRGKKGPSEASITTRGRTLGK